MGKSGPLERAQLANQIQGFRIPDRSDAWENNKYMLFAGQEVRIGKKLCQVLGTALGLRSRAVLKTSGTVFPNADLLAGK